MVWGFFWRKHPRLTSPFSLHFFYFSALANFPTPDVLPMFAFPLWRPPEDIIIAA
jgi:hypothetical protein